MNTDAANTSPPPFNLKWAVSRATTITLQVAINHETHWIRVPKRTASAIAKHLGGEHASKAWLAYYESHPARIAEATPDVHVQYDDMGEDVMWEWDHGELHLYCS